MNLLLIVAVTHTTEAVVNLSLKKTFRPERDSNPDLCDTGAGLYRLSYQAIWELFTL